MNLKFEKWWATHHINLDGLNVGTIAQLAFEAGQKSANEEWNKFLEVDEVWPEDSSDVE